MGQRHRDGIPFQFSLHIQCPADGDLEHQSLLAANTVNPRPEIMPRLLEAVPREGPVLAYNAPFELARLD